MMTRTARRLTTSTSVCVLLWAAVSHAIVWGVPDGNNHPNVGALFVKFDPVFSLGPGVPPGVFPVCSGSVIAKSGNRALFLTAGHCIEPLINLVAALGAEGLNPVPVVSFSSNLHQDLGILIPVDMSALHWRLGQVSTTAVGALPSFDDIGVIVLQANDAADLPEPVTLADQGLLDALGASGYRASELRVVGFGDDITEPTPHTRVRIFGIREVAYPRPVNLGEKFVMAQQHGPSGSSGAYFGDSGGPIFWVDPASGSETVIAIVGWPVGGLLNDKSTLAQHYRIDTAFVLGFIEQVKSSEGF
jgi:hypothetical protein